MSRNTIARYLKIIAVLTVYAFYTLRSKTVRQARNLGKLLKGLVVKTKCILQDKLRWGLVPWKQMEDVVKVLMGGASKYSDDNWMKVDIERYRDAILRHELAYQGGEIMDKDSGIHHLAHVVCNALFIMWHEANPARRR